MYGGFIFLSHHFFCLNSKSQEERKKEACLRYDNFSHTSVGLELQTGETSKVVIQKKKELIHNKPEPDILAQCYSCDICIL